MRLSLEQRAAAAELRGAVRVVAGAGTGKTAVIAERFRRLVAAGAAPGSILVMTFSERAASEMRNRICAALGDGAGPLAVGTFHSLALSWLREDGWRVGVPAGFQLLAGAERWILLREVMWELGDPALVGSERPDELVARLLKLLERLKQELVPLQRLEEWCRAAKDDERAEYLHAAVRLFRAFGSRCRAQRRLDFDDLLVEAVRLLDSQPELRQAYGRRYPHLMVDEYQDTNLAQERLVELLGSESESVFVVGDDDQSIYRFRGASRANMERFLHRFPGARTRWLETNRRSQRRIVESAGNLIANNEGRLPKRIRAQGRVGTPVEIAAYADGGEEAASIAARISGLVATLPAAQVALLVRTNAIARPLLKKLDDAGQPYELKGALGFYERPEIRDLVAYLRLLGDPADKIALARLLTRPPLPAKADEVLPQIAGWAEPLRALLQVENYARWAATVLDLSALVTRIGVDELFFELMERTRHLDALRPTAGAQWERLLANTSRFSELIAEFCERSRDHSLSGFLTYLDLVLLSGVDEEVAEPERPVRDAVQVMTIHQAKGLEFEAVFIPALVEGRLPQSIWRDALELPAAVLEPSVRAREDHIAEERRLLYVAMTRARSRLYLSWARRYEGSRTWRPSRFLEEVRSGAAATDVERPTNVVTLSTPTDDQHANGRAKLPPPRVELSFSSAAAYRECPRQYWYRYAARLPALQPLEGRYGSAVHAALMGAGAARREGRLLTREVLEPLYSRAWEGAGITDARRGPVLRQLGWDQLVRYVEGGGLAVAPRLVEQPFTADLDGWRLRGIIDRVDPPPTQRGGEVGLEGREKNRDEDDGGAWRLVDYKTGNPMPASRLRRDFQLALYALGAKHGLGLEPLELEIVYLKTGQSVVMAADEALLSEARRVADEVVDGIRQQRFEARPERRRCQLCPYRLACPDAL